MKFSRNRKKELHAGVKDGMLQIRIGIDRLANLGREMHSRCNIPDSELFAKDVAWELMRDRVGMNDLEEALDFAICRAVDNYIDYTEEE